MIDKLAFKKAKELEENKLDKKDIDWITPTLINGWTASDYWGGIRYGKDVLNIVHISGAVSNGEDGIIFQLPQGYRPSQVRVFFIAYAGGQVGEVLEGEVRRGGNVIIPAFAGKGQLKFQVSFFARSDN